MSSERPPSVLFGVPMPEPGVLTAGQRWTAALAVLLAALLLVANGDGRTLVTAPAPAPTPASAAPRPATPATPPLAPASRTLPPPAAPLPDPSFDLGGAPAPSPGSAPDPSPPPDDAPSQPPPGEEPPPCSVPVPPVLAGAGLCPRA